MPVFSFVMPVKLVQKIIDHEFYYVSRDYSSISFVSHFISTSIKFLPHKMMGSRFFLSLPFNKFSLNFAKNFYVKLFECGPNDELVRDDNVATKQQHTVTYAHTFHISDELWCDKYLSKFISNSRKIIGFGVWHKWHSCVLGWPINMSQFQRDSKRPHTHNYTRFKPTTVIPAYKKQSHHIT